MKRLLLILLPALLAAGCANLDLAPVGDPERIVSGTVNFTTGEPLPADAVLTVRVIDNSDPAMGPRILGEQQIKAPGASPVAFQVEFRAEDPLLRRGVKVEARIAVGGRVRFASPTNHAVTDANIATPREIWLAALGG